MARRTIKGKKFLWHHITTLEEDDVEFLRSEFQFHILDFEDLFAHNPLPKLDVYKHYLFAVFQMPKWNQAHRVDTDDLEVFLGADYLVTVAKRPIESIERMAERAERNAKFRNVALGRDPAFLLYRLLRVLFLQSQAIVTEMVTQMNELETEVYEHECRETTRKLALLRRDIMSLRTSVDPQRSMVTTIGAVRKSYMTEDLEVFYDDVRDVLDTVWMVSENLKQIVDGLFEVNNALLTRKINDIMTVFTAIAAVLMPPTLVAGFYGMNVSWLPFAENPLSIAVLYFFSVLLFFAVLIPLRRMR